jgi:hypothetical protein
MFRANPSAKIVLPLPGTPTTRHNVGFLIKYATAFRIGKLGLRNGIISRLPAEKYSRGGIAVKAIVEIREHDKISVLQSTEISSYYLEWNS